MEGIRDGIAVYIEGPIERNLPREPIFPKQMGDSVPWASLPWKTKSFSMRW
jgi:hypothetical protein